jgi:peptide/nickel transport system substrate-binding protein
MESFKDSRRGVSKTVIAAAVVLIIIIVVAALYVLEVGPFAKPSFPGIIMGTTDSVESSVDPAQAYDYFGWEILSNTGATLVETEPGTGNILPCLATSWSPSDDGLTWNFTLRQGVYFDDNVTEFNATYVKYSFDRSMGIASPDGPQLNIGYSDIIENVTVISKYVVQFNLKIPFASFLGLMACAASSMVNPAYAGGWKTTWGMGDIVNYTAGDARASNPMDLGPYKLTKWTRAAGKDKEMLLEANPYYWRAGYPKTEEIKIKFYADATSLRQAIEGGEVDIAFRHITATDINDLKTKTNVKVWEGTGAEIQYMVFQEDPVGTLPQLNDTRIRIAIAAALNRSEVCETVFLGQKTPLYSMIPIGMLGHTEAFKALGDANYTLTQSLLAEVGYNATHKLPIELWYETSGHYSSSADQAALYKEQLEGSGVISVTLKSADWPSYRVNRNTGVMHVFIYGWYPDYIDPDDYAFLYWASWLNHHYSEYNATNHYQDMVNAYDAARATTNETLREELYAELEDYAVMDCPIVPIWQGRGFAVTKLDIKGVYLDITETWRMWYLYKEG